MTGFEEIKRVTQVDDLGEVLTRIVRRGESIYVEQLDRYWNRYEEESADDLADAERLLVEWAR